MSAQQCIIPGCTNSAPNVCETHLNAPQKSDAAKVEPRIHRIADDATPMAQLSCDFCGRAAAFFCYRCRAPLCVGHREKVHDCSPAAWPASDKGAFRKPAGAP